MNNEKEKQTEIEEPIEQENQKPENGKPKNKRIKSMLRSRKFKRGWLSVAISCIFIAAIVIVNMISGLLVDKFPVLSADLTNNGVYQLTDDTIDFLKTVDKQGKEITIKVLASKSDYENMSTYYLQANRLLQMYTQYSDSVKIEYIDLAANPTFATKYPNDTITAGNYIVECGEKHRMLSQNDLFQTGYDQTTGQTTVEALTVEPAVTTAILNVTSEDQTKVAFLDGLQSLDSAAFKNLLQSNNYEVSDVNLVTGDLDQEINTVVLFAPSVDLDTASAKKLAAFLNNNGAYEKNLVFVPSDITAEMPNIDSILAEWGMVLEKGVVIENDEQHLLSAQTPYFSILDYSNDEYKSGLKNPDLPVLGGYMRPIEITDSTKVVPLLSTSAKAKLFPFNADENFKMDDVKAQQYTAAAVSTQGTEAEKSTVTVFSSVATFTESYINISTFNNGAYIANLFNIVSERADDGITIEGKNMKDASLGIVASQTQVLSFIFVGLIPLAILIVGFVIWLTRRNK